MDSNWGRGLFRACCTRHKWPVREARLDLVSPPPDQREQPSQGGFVIIHTCVWCRAALGVGMDGTPSRNTPILRQSRS